MPLTAKVLNDEFASLTTVVVTDEAPRAGVAAIAKEVDVIIAPTHCGRINLRWLLKKLGSENVTSLLVEGGGETNALFLEQQLAHRVAFFYAPKILGGRNARKGVAGDGFAGPGKKILLNEVEWKNVGEDLLLLARINNPRSQT
jgi:diaminohydroxyphosphoribosylaminopyrimidine deaminase/5-amino-6-(5-phosphoribosylamino)uracil reductase